MKVNVVNALTVDIINIELKNGGVNITDKENRVLLSVYIQDNVVTLGVYTNLEMKVVE